MGNNNLVIQEHTERRYFIIDKVYQRMKQIHESIDKKYIILTDKIVALNDKRLEV